jgi:hypothetical protein
MGDALAEIEAAITEVTKARQSVMRRSSKQVFSGEEIDRLKSVAFAWFQTHRPSIADHPQRPDLHSVDAAVQSVMKATGCHAARRTYTKALQEAKEAMVVVRSVIAATPNAPQQTTAVPSTTDAPPNFAPLAGNPRMQAILNNRWQEVQRCASATAGLAATVMMGGLLESLLLARINASPRVSAIYTATHAPRDKAGKTLPLGEWKLANMVEVAHEHGWVTKSARDVGHVPRDFRNYIHPHKEFTDGVVISTEDVQMFWEVTKAICRQLLGSVGKSP